jgi:oxidase EvaA
MRPPTRLSKTIAPLDLDSTRDGFLLSALTEDNRFQSTEAFMSWFHSRAKAHPFSVKQIPFALLDQWYFKEPSQDLAHISGKFFTVEGLRVSTNFGPVEEWDQPIINQPEIGILGIITKKFGGIRYFLMQAKMEPGNVNMIQLSPTVQATRSNYTRVHKGRLPAYLEYFVDRSKSRYLVDQLQTEQGARFLRKRNRNMIVQVDHDVPLYKDFCWLTLGQIKRLLAIDNFVNMDARSVLSCIPFIDENVKACYGSRLYHDLDDFSQELLASMYEGERACHSTSEIISWFTEMKTKYRLHVERIPLAQVRRWTRTDWQICHETKRFFSVMAVAVQAGNREVHSWTQPLLQSAYHGLVGFLAQKQNDVLHFLVQAKVEPGNFDVIDMAPTVSCSDVELVCQKPTRSPFLDIFMNAPPHQIRYSAIQSEEGGRFYHFQNRYMVVELDESTRLETPENFVWMPLAQIMEFVKHSYFNVEARGLLACISLL